MVLVIAKLASHIYNSSLYMISEQIMTDIILETPQQLKDFVLKCLEEKKAEGITTIDLGEKASLTRYMIFASGRSTKNIGAIAEFVSRELKHLGIPSSIEGLGKSEWVLLDVGDVIVHVFHPEAREYFKLEDKWNKHAKDA